MGEFLPLYVKNDRSRAVIAASDHHPVIVGPALHDGAALQRRVYIPADRVPRLAAELSIHQMIKIILLGRAFQQKLIAHVEKRTRPGFWVGQVLLLIFGKAFLVQNCNLTLVLHTSAPYSI